MLRQDQSYLQIFTQTVVWPLHTTPKLSRKHYKSDYLRLCKEKKKTVGIVRVTVAIDLKLISKDYFIVEMKKG